MEKKTARIKQKKAKKVKAVKAPKKVEKAGPKEFEIPVYNTKGKEVAKFKLNKDLFNGEVNKDVLYQAVIMYNANQRQGNASTKTRGDVSGGGKKPWRQKGTGRARAGSSRSPLWRHGGSIFGPHTRDYYYSIPKKIRRIAFLSSINAKLNDEKLVGVDSIQLDEGKTKKFAAILSALKVNGKSLVVTDSIDPKIMLASRNISDVAVKTYKDFNTMDVLKCDKLIISMPALEKLPERFKE